MADKTGISWTDSTWNPIAGCSVISPGCTNCYAMAMAARIERMNEGVNTAAGVMICEANYSHTHYEGLTQPSKAGPVWTGKVAQAPEHILTQPLRWKRPRRIFVNSMSDLFHETIPDEWIDEIFAVMQRARRHTFLILTKRPARMRTYINALYDKADGDNPKWFARGFYWPLGLKSEMTKDAVVPFGNIWLGVTTEDGQRFRERVPDLLATPAARHFISYEPALGPLDGCDISGLDWVICGGESGPNARPMHPAWAQGLRDQCAAAGVPYFFKQWGEWAPSTTRPERMIISHDGDLDIPDSRCADEQAGEAEIARVGKRAAGDLLDGRQHHEFPRMP